jgi:hypothetical protein
MRAIKIIVLLLVLSAVGIIIWQRSTRRFNTTTTFFIDEETGDESIRSTHDVPPLLGKSNQPTVVQVFKFTCDGGKTVKTAYYSKYTDGMKRQLEAVYQANKTPDFDTTQGMLIRSPGKGSPWVHWGTPEATKVLNALSCPEGGDIETVFPP